MSENQNLEQKLGQPLKSFEKKSYFLESNTPVQKLREVVKIFPQTVGVSLISYAAECSLGFPLIFEESLDSGISRSGYHFAVVAGFYGGVMKGTHHKVASLAMLATTFVPEILSVAQDGDLNRAGMASASKAIVYGASYLLGLAARS